MATSYTFSYPGSCSGLDVQVYDAAGSTVGSVSTVGDSADAWGPATYTAALTYDADGYTAKVTDEHGIVIAEAPGVIDVEAAIGGLPAVAAFVADADDTDAASVAAAVDALRDALIAAGLMASE
jgi:hypothetical protein